MSDPGTQTPDSAPEPTLIEQPGTMPETTELPQEPAEPVEEAAPAAEAKPAEPPKPPEPKKTPWWQTRIDQTTRARREAERRAEAAEAKLAALQPRTEPEPAQPYRPEQFEQVIEQRANAIVAQREVERRSRGFLEAGEKEFGREGFQEKCNEVAALGAGDSREFMQLVTDPDIMPDGPKVVAALADHPEEAQRILAMDPLKMAAALTRFATTMKEPEKKISNAPAPIKPVGGSAKPSEPSDTMPMKQWLEMRNKTARNTAGGKPNH